MSQMPGDNFTSHLVDEDAPMYNQNNGQHSNTNSTSTQGHTNFEAAVYQELVESRQVQTHLMELLMRQLQPATTMTASYPVEEPRNEGHKKLAADPQPFDGTAGKLEEIFSDLTLCFMADPDKFKLPRAKIVYALSYMKGGSAHSWATNILKEKKDLWPTWEEFEDTVWKRFEMGNQKVEAQNVMGGLRQGGRPVEEFFDAFETHKPYSGLNDEACVNILHHALDCHLIESIYNQNKVPTTYHDWKDLAIHKD